MTSSKPNFLPKDPSPNITTLGVGASISEFEKGHTLVHSNLSTHFSPSLYRQDSVYIHCFHHFIKTALIRVTNAKSNCQFSFLILLVPTSNICHGLITSSSWNTFSPWLPGYHTRSCISFPQDSLLVLPSQPDHKQRNAPELRPWTSTVTSLICIRLSLESQSVGWTAYLTWPLGWRRQNTLK